jgi:hypothetical protein
MRSQVSTLTGTVVGGSSLGPHPISTPGPQINHREP